MVTAQPNQGARGFRLEVRPSAAGVDFGVTLVETNGGRGDVGVVQTAGRSQTQAVLPALRSAVTDSGYARSALGPRRRKPFRLGEEAGVRLALALLATAPVRKARRRWAMSEAVDALAAEEAYYWYARCVGPDASRYRRALRIFLAEE